MAVESIACRTGVMLAILLIACLGQAIAGTLTYTITERLGRAWTDETVTYPVTFAQGECLDGSVRLTGPGGAEPVQLFAVTCWPDSHFIKSATLAFIVASLQPQETLTYTVTYGTALPPTPMPASDLRFETTNEYLQATTTDFGVRFRLGTQVFNPPVSPVQAPGPIIAMRTAGGVWFGGSRLYGAATVSSCTATVLDQGPVTVRVQYDYAYADGTSLRIILRLDAQDNRIIVDTVMDGNKADDGWDVLLTPHLTATALQFMPEQVNLQPGTTLVNGWRNKALADYTPGILIKLSPWGDWYDENYAPSFYLVPTDATRELVVKRLRPDVWVDPGPVGSFLPASVWQSKTIQLRKDADGIIYLRNNNIKGRRVWMLGEVFANSRPPVATKSCVMDTEPVGSLDDVKDLILDWTATAETHPRLYLNPAELADAGTRFPAEYAALRNVADARADLATLGYYDTMRRTAATICRYDAVVDSGLITEKERALFRAQMAFIAYRLASPATWSNERGYRSGNENMTITQTMNLGLLACALRDHPMAPTWVAYARQRYEQWLDRLDSDGYWHESSHYARVSASRLLWFAVAMQKAGFHDYFTDPRLQRFCMFYEKTLTPPDALVAPKRLTPPYGRGSHSSNWGFGGLAARAMFPVAPELSRIMAWSYEKTDYGPYMGDSMAGYERLYPLRTLPTQPPHWASEYLPSLGPLFRSGLDTQLENYLLLATQYPTNPDGEFWPSEVGGVLHWFARGKPLSRRFGSLPVMNNDHGLLVNRVMLATNWEPGMHVPAGYVAATTRDGLALLPRLDYVNAGFNLQVPWTFIDTPPTNAPAFPTVPQIGQPPAHWRRQLLWVHSEDVNDAQYLLFRDTLTGGQPSQWQFWTLSNRIDEVGAPQQGNGARALSGDRFTAVGSFGVDVEYYVASPTDTPRHTLRYTSGDHGYSVPEYAVSQDLLHLQLPGNGHYFVVLFPREHAATTPTFTTLGDGKVIKVKGDFGADYAFLSDAVATVTAEQAVFTGAAGSVQDRTGGLALALGAAGSVTYQGTRGLTAPMPCCLRFAADRLTLTLQAGHAGGLVEILAPGLWQLEPRQTGVTLSRQNGMHRLNIAAGVTQVTLLPYDGPLGKPDLHIRNSDDVYIGDDIYNAAGTNQSKSQTARVGATIMYLMQVQNDGPITDTITVKGAAGGNGWSVYYKDTATNANVTAAMTGNGWSTGPLEPGAKKGLFVQLVPNAAPALGNAKTLTITATSANDVTQKDVVKAIYTAKANYQPDLWIRPSTETEYTGDRIYSTDGENQAKSMTITTGRSGMFLFQVQNDAVAEDSFKITGTAGSDGWVVTYYETGTNINITPQVTGGGWIAGPRGSGLSKGLYVTMQPTAIVTRGAQKAITVTATSVGDPTRNDMVRAVATAEISAQPDLLLRPSTEGNYSGDHVYSTNGFNQTKQMTTANGKTVMFLFRVQNDGTATDSYTITGTSGGAGWKVIYRETATNADITTAVTGGGWTVNNLAKGATKGLYVQLVPHGLAVGSTDTLVITAVSTSDNMKKDAVRAETTVVNPPLRVGKR